MLPKATDEAFFVRRLRARAGNIVAPGSLFSFPDRCFTQSLHVRVTCTSGTLSTLRVATVDAVDAVRVPAPVLLEL
jgi:hypothetical protein